MSNESLVKNKIIGDGQNEIVLNNTLKVKHTPASGDNHNNSSILLKNKTSNSSNITYGEIYLDTVDGVTNLYIKPDSSVDSSNIFIDKNNLESELEEVYNDRSLNIKNLSVGLNNSTDDVYINFLSTSDTNETDNGVGFKYEQSGGDIFYKERGGAWTSISSVTGVTTLGALTDVNLSGLADKQLLIYNNSNSRWENETNITLPGTLDLGGNLTVGSNYLKFNNDHGLVDSVGNEIINLKGNTSVKGNVNYIQIENAAPGGEPKLKTYGSDSSIGLDIETKGEGDITLTSESGNVVVSGTNLDISGYQKSSIYSTSSNASYIPEQSWNIPISSDTILFDFIEADTAGTYVSNVTAGIHGQKMNVIFNNSGSKSINVLVDFDDDKLITGTGLSRKLKFVRTGQSASLVYLGNSINKWQVLNTGAIVL